jgi:hypothetical protein
MRPRALQTPAAGLAGLVSVLLGIVLLAAAPAHAGPPTYSATGGGVFDPVANTTTFTFAFGNQDISELRFEPCSAATFVSGNGPSPSAVQTTSTGGSGVTGLQFHPAPVGNYTVVYQGNIAALELFANPGPGQTQLEVGFPGCTFPPTTTTTSTTAAPVTTTTSSTSTSTSTTAPATTSTTAKASVAPAAADPSTTSTVEVQVLGATVVRAAPVAAPAGPALPFTGAAHTTVLLAFGLLLLVMGMTLVTGSRHQLAMAAVRTARPLASPARQQERPPVARSGAAVSALCLLAVAALLDKHARRR